MHMILRLQQGGQCHKNTCSKIALFQRKSIGNDRSNKLKLGENLLYMFLYLLFILLDDDSPLKKNIVGFGVFERETANQT